MLSILLSSLTLFLGAECTCELLYLAGLIWFDVSQSSVLLLWFLHEFLLSYYGIL